MEVKESKSTTWKVLGRFGAQLGGRGFAQSCGIEPADKAQELGKKELNRLVEAIKGWKLGDVEEVVLEKGEVVAGG
ncbi:MAG: hypothetical protein R2688_04715 [Fimbriimonadaceae bacterium]